MTDLITKLIDIHQEEIYNKIEVLNNEEVFIDNCVKNLGGTLFEAFDLTTTSEYSEYIEILNEIDKLDENLSARLEAYLTKEMNLMALLGFDFASKNK